MAGLTCFYGVVFGRGAGDWIVLYIARDTSAGAVKSDDVGTLMGLWPVFCVMPTFYVSDLA